MHLAGTVYFLGISRVAASHDDWTHAWSHQEQGDEPAHDVSRPVGEQMTGQRQQAGKAEEDKCHTECKVGTCLQEHSTNVPLPCCSHARKHRDGTAHAALALMDAFCHALWKQFLHPAVCRVSQTDDVWSEECGEYAHRHHYGIEELAGHMQALSQCGYNECKLTYLHQRKAALDGVVQRVSGHEEAQTAKYHLPQSDGQRDDQNGPPVLYEYRRVNHHAH